MIVHWQVTTPPGISPLNWEPKWVFFCIKTVGSLGTQHSNQWFQTLACGPDLTTKVQMKHWELHVTTFSIINLVKFQKLHMSFTNQTKHDQPRAQSQLCLDKNPKDLGARWLEWQAGSMPCWPQQLVLVKQFQWHFQTWFLLGIGWKITNFHPIPSRNHVWRCHWHQPIITNCCPQQGVLPTCHSSHLAPRSLEISSRYSWDTAEIVHLA